MPTHSVEAQLESRVHMALVQLVEKCLVHQPAVGIDGGDADLALVQGIYDAEEVFSDQRLATRDARLAYATFLQLVRDCDNLLVAGRTMLCMYGPSRP